MWLSDKKQRLDVYCFAKNNEFTSIENIELQEGEGLPAQSTMIEVIKVKEGFARVFNEADQVWGYIEDHRGEDVYSSIDGQKVEIKELGALPENLTYQPRPSEYHDFIEGNWIEDIEAREQAEKQAKIDALNSEMAKLRNDIIFGQAMGDDVSAQVERVKEIREELVKLES